jgi:hypothetical protein
MKEQLISLAKEKEFESSVIGKSVNAKYSSKPFYYLWMCELQKWLREVHSIDVVMGPERYKTGVNYMVQAQKWDLNVDEDSHYNFVVKGSYWFNDNNEYPTYEDALEKGLQEALKLIE